MERLSKEAEKIVLKYETPLGVAEALLNNQLTALEQRHVEAIVTLRIWEAACLRTEWRLFGRVPHPAATSADSVSTTPPPPEVRTDFRRKRFGPQSSERGPIRF